MMVVKRYKLPDMRFKKSTRDEMYNKTTVVSAAVHYI